MITVAILINGNPLVAKNCVNQMRQNEKGETAYKTDAGEIIWHHRDKGAVALAHRLLDCIKNDEPHKEKG